MSDLEIVDCHHHLWDLDQHNYEWLQVEPIFDTFIGDYSSICRNYLIDDYLGVAEPAGVSKSVHVQCEYDRANPTGETAWLQAIADEYGFPHGIVGFANLTDPDLRAVLEGHIRFKNFRGIRQNLNWDKNDPRRSFSDRGDYLTDDAWWKGFSMLEEYGLSFDLQILPHQMRQAVTLVASHPDTPVIVNHAGLPIDRSVEALGVWREGMALLASQPNTSVKLSGFAMMDHRWSLVSIRPIVLETIDLFGVDRCMFASNFPVDGLYADYAGLMAIYRLVVEGMNADEQAALFGGNAQRFYRL